MAAAALGEVAPPRSPWRTERKKAVVPPDESGATVVNLGSLWAGPLAARLVGATGVKVIHVESRTRPDPTRGSAPEFYQGLRAGHEVRRIDFSRTDGLADLLRSADIVIEASRPRALRALRTDADTIMADGRPRTWLRITAHPDQDRIGFGDDAAVAAGLVRWDPVGPVFVGDAVADPLTGLVGALAVVGNRCATDQVIIDINLAEVAALARALSPS
jgi:crotonobetainyl-CoA:carnitine CoA-transferase CaiB-like acyl-CoA transferase